MEKKTDKATAPVDKYIEGFPEPVRKRLTSIRRLIRGLAPDAQEKIAYRIPTFFLNGNLVHYAAFKNHIGLFPTASGVEEFESELARYKHARGSIQFPMDEPLPMDLIARIVRFRVQENRAKAGSARKPRARLRRS